MEWTAMRFEQDKAYAESLEKDKQKKVKEQMDIIEPKLTLSELREKRLKVLDKTSK